MQGLGLRAVSILLVQVLVSNAEADLDAVQHETECSPAYSLVPTRELGLLRWLCRFFYRSHLLKPQTDCDGVEARVSVDAAANSTFNRRCRIHGQKASHRIFRHLGHLHIPA